MIFMNRRMFLTCLMVLSLGKPLYAIYPPPYEWQDYVDPDVAVCGLITTTSIAALSTLYFWYGKRTARADLKKTRGVVGSLEKQVTTLNNRYKMQECLNQLARDYEKYELTYKEYQDILGSNRSEKDKEQELFTRVTQDGNRSFQGNYTVHDHKKKVSTLLEAVDLLDFSNLESSLKGLLTSQKQFLKEQLVLLVEAIDAVEGSLNYVQAYQLQKQLRTELEEELTLSSLTVSSQEYTLALECILRSYNRAVKKVEPYPYRAYMDRIDQYATQLAQYRSFMRKHTTLLDHTELKNFVESTYVLLRTIQSTLQKHPVYLLQCQLHTTDLENEKRRREEERRHQELVDLKKKEVSLQQENNSLLRTRIHDLENELTLAHHTRFMNNNSMYS